MSLASPLETVCRSQIELYLNTYDHVLMMAADSALAVQRPDDISSTHLLVLHLTWNKDAGTRIEEQFSFSRADIETNAWYEARVTGVDRKEEEDAINTPGMKRSLTFGRDVMLEADFIAGRRLDLPDDSPRILTRILVVVRPTVAGNERIPPIIRRVFHKSDVCVQLSLLNPHTQLTLSSCPVPSITVDAPFSPRLSISAGWSTSVKIWLIAPCRSPSTQPSTFRATESTQSRPRDKLNSG
jgi:hypothetical protein